MSFIKELEETHDSIKTIALNLLLIPFWYVSIFIFNNEFNKSLFGENKNHQKK